MPKISAKLKWGHHNGGAECRWCKWKLATSTNNSLWLENVDWRKRCRLSSVASLSRWASTFVCSTFAVLQCVTRVRQRQLILVYICLPLLVKYTGHLYSTLYWVWLISGTPVWHVLTRDHSFTCHPDACLEKNFHVICRQSSKRLHFIGQICIFYAMWLLVIILAVSVIVEQHATNCIAFSLFYTQWTIKKRDILFFTITLANLNRFLQFLYRFNREEILHATVVKFTTSP